MLFIRKNTSNFMLLKQSLANRNKEKRHFLENKFVKGFFLSFLFGLSMSFVGNAFANQNQSLSDKNMTDHILWQEDDNVSNFSHEYKVNFIVKKNKTKREVAEKAQKKTAIA